jgi:hypothetical protein
MRLVKFPRTDMFEARTGRKNTRTGSLHTPG